MQMFLILCMYVNVFDFMFVCKCWYVNGATKLYSFGGDLCLKKISKAVA